VALLVGHARVSLRVFHAFGRVLRRPPAERAAGLLGRDVEVSFDAGQAGAPPFQVHMLPQKLHKLTLVGTNMIFFALVNMMRYAVLSLGQISSENMPPPCCCCVRDRYQFLGIWMVRRRDRSCFTR